MSDLSQDASLASAVGAVPYHQTFKGDKMQSKAKKLQPRYKVCNGGFAAVFRYIPAPFTEAYVKM